jgi:hypothetical protein
MSYQSFTLKISLAIAAELDGATTTSENGLRGDEQ